MKDDPFSSLSGLDQQLFHDERQVNKQTSKLVSKQASSDAVPQVSKPESPDAEQGSSIAAAPPPSRPGNKEAEKGSRKPAGHQASRTPVSQSSGHTKSVRVDARHTYDIFHDQVRWMNRMKLDIEDTYESRITINGIVKLALDLLREDYDVNGEDSNLIRVLVDDGTIRLPGLAPVEKEEEG